MDSVNLRDAFPIPEGGLQILQITQKTGGPIMQKIKKRLSLLLVLCLLLGVALPAMPMPRGKMNSGVRMVLSTAPATMHIME